MAGNEQGTMEGKTHIQATGGPSRDALRSRPHPADAGIGEWTGTYPAAPIATRAEVLTEASDPRLARTGATRIPA